VSWILSRGAEAGRAGEEGAHESARAPETGVESPSGDPDPRPGGLRSRVESLYPALEETVRRCGEAAGAKKRVRAACLDLLSGRDRAEEDRLEQTARLLKGIDAEPALEGGFLLYHRMMREIETLRAMDFSAAAPLSGGFESDACRVSGEVLYHAKRPGGHVVVGGTGQNLYDGRFLLIIDPAGDDRYRLSGSAPGAVSVILDLAGDDVYGGDDFSVASGLFGVGLLIDDGGHDTYRAGDFSCGCGIAGLGILEDRSGDDVYAGGCVSQGAGAFHGAGLLYDRAGRDRYRVDLYGQGFGTALGAGLLWDGSGGDTYDAGGKYRDIREQRKYFRSLSQGCGMGLRPAVPGGAGILFDRAGDDIYRGDYFVQGTGSWYGLGALLDLAGDDVYQARRYSQGAGIHASAGILADEAGDDVYRAWGVSQGTGHDLAVGFLREAGGTDRFEADWLSRGAGSANGIGIFLELAGDDAYGGEQRESNGAGRRHRSFGSVGLFVDYSGEDRYEKTGRNRGTWLQADYGIGIDIENSADFD
jgi:hypothetical protein